MKTILTTATAFILSLTLSVKAQSTTSNSEAVKTETKSQNTVKKATKKNVVSEKKATKNNEIDQQRSGNEKIKAKTEKEGVENNIQTIIAEIKTEEKKLEELKAQQNDPSNANKDDEAIKNTENKINEMTEKLKKENEKLKKLNKIILENN